MQSTCLSPMRPAAPRTDMLILGVGEVMIGDFGESFCCNFTRAIGRGRKLSRSTYLLFVASACFSETEEPRDVTDGRPSLSSQGEKKEVFHLPLTSSHRLFFPHDSQQDGFDDLQIFLSIFSSFTFSFRFHNPISIDFRT